MELNQTNCVVFKNITKNFKEKKSKKLIQVYKDFSLELPLEKKDKIIAFVGKSGSGKTTLLRIISGLELANSGTVLVNNKIVKSPTQTTTLIPQQFTCFPWLNVYDNIAFGLNLKRANHIDDTVQRISKELGLQERLNAYPSELSGGMQQRVAIGRALAVDVPILLMDEPFGSLDAETREEMQRIVIDISEKSDTLIILVTHDLKDAILLSDIILVLPERPISIITSIIRIPFTRPRSSELIHTNEFIALYHELRNLL